MAKQSQRYLVIGMIFIFIMIALFVGLVINVLTAGQIRSSIVLAAAGAFIGYLGGFFIVVYVGKRRAESQHARFFALSRWSLYRR